MKNLDLSTAQVRELKISVGPKASRLHKPNLLLHEVGPQYEKLK